MKASFIGVAALTCQERRRRRWSVDTFIDGILSISLLSVPVGTLPQFWIPCYACRVDHVLALSAIARLSER
jgi:hypothetical protein